MRPDVRCYRDGGYLFGVLVSLGLLLAFVLPSHSQGVAAQRTNQEETLRRRANEFYSLLQVGNWSQAEAYVARNSLDTFRNERKNPFLGFRIDSVSIDPEGTTGTVTVQMSVFSPFSTTPFPFLRTTRWVLVKNGWFLELPKPNPAAFQELFAHRSAKGERPQAEELKFKGHTYWLGSFRSGEVKIARFPFTNVTDHEVTISAVLTGCECLKVTTKKTTYRPGESGELAIEFDSTDFSMDYAQTVVVKTNPGDRTTLLNIEAFVRPTSWPAPKPQSANKSEQ
jgi:Protein of unknown function (DUF1573)